MRTYAVKLEDGTYGPEFSSTEEASSWGFATLFPDDLDRSISLEIAYLRDGREVGNCLSTRLARTGR